MKKIIWGIAVVFCVQVGFQLAMTADRSNADYAALRTPLQNGIDMPSPTLAADALDSNIAPVEPAAQDERIPIQTKVLIRYVRVPSPERHATPSESTTAFKPVVITYNRAGALTDAPKTAVAEQRPAAKQQPLSEDKRSLVAKVLSKPYDWIRTVGSKLH